MSESHPVDSAGPGACCVSWGHSACALPRGHDPEAEVRVHRQFEPSEHAVTVREAFLFGDGLTPSELRIRMEEWGE